MGFIPPVDGAYCILFKNSGLIPPVDGAALGIFIYFKNWGLMPPVEGAGGYPSSNAFGMFWSKKKKKKHVVTLIDSGRRSRKKIFPTSTGACIERVAASPPSI